MRGIFRHCVSLYCPIPRVMYPVIWIFIRAKDSRETVLAPRNPFRRTAVYSRTGNKEKCKSFVTQRGISHVHRKPGRDISIHDSRAPDSLTYVCNVYSHFSDTEPRGASPASSVSVCPNGYRSISAHANYSKCKSARKLSDETRVDACVLSDTMAFVYLECVVPFRGERDFRRSARLETHRRIINDAPLIATRSLSSSLETPWVDHFEKEKTYLQFWYSLIDQQEKFGTIVRHISSFVRRQRGGTCEADYRRRHQDTKQYHRAGRT